MRFISMFVMLSFFGVNMLTANNSDIYGLVGIFVKDSSSAVFLSKLIDEENPSRINPGAYIEAPLTSMQIGLLKSQGIKYSVITDNLNEYYKTRLTESYEKAIKDNKLFSEENFRTGSMGGFFRLNEIYDAFEDIITKYPEFHIRTDTIGSTLEQRPIIAYTFGSGDSTSKEVLFTALHHAREPIGASLSIYFMWNILERAANNDPEALYLLKSRIIYLIPVVNPDGYFYNESLYPETLGLWRKNRRIIGSDTLGVDLNRNYGPYEYWNSYVNGSSEEPKYETYRGEAPFSEPETQAIRNFCLHKNISTAINFHAFGNMLIYPYGAFSSETDDSALFRIMASQSGDLVRLAWGLDLQTVGYSSRGNADDWMYLQDSTKNRTISMTAEIGTNEDGFYPVYDRQIQLVKENSGICYETLWNAGSNLKPAKAIAVFDTMYRRAFIKVTICNTGRFGSRESVLKLDCTNSDIRIINPDRIIPELESTGEVVEIFELNLPPAGFTNAVEIPFNVLITQENVERKSLFNIRLYHYQQIDLFDGKDLSMWTPEFWNLEPDQDKPGYMVLSDSPGSDYLADTVNYLTLAEPFYVDDTIPSFLGFTSKWEIEKSYDFAVVELSSDNGESWNNIRTSLMQKASGIKNSKQEDTTKWGFRVFMPFWQYQEYSLEEYKGRKILIRFGVLSDKFRNFDGWKINSICIRQYPGMEYLSVEDISFEDADIIYPVPVHNGNILNLKLPGSLNSELLSFYIFGPDGRLIKNGSIPSSNIISIPTEGMAGGTYVIEISDGKFFLRKKFLLLP